MSWYSIREYTRRYNVSPSTVRRHIQQGRISARKFGRNWYIEYPDHGDGVMRISQAERDEEFEELPAPAEGSNLRSVIDFSSKALHHYLLMHEKLVAEKELRLAEREREIVERRQEVAELEGYVKLLEEEIARLKERPEGWV
jgi:excisionase family DNA binding protein